MDTMKHIGTWRSLVACLHGAQEVPGSNPGVPTSKERLRLSFVFPGLLCYS